jgi:hypothetical protein
VGRLKEGFGWQIVVPIFGFILICGATVVIIQFFKHTENEQPLSNGNTTYDILFTLIEHDIDMLEDFVKRVDRNSSKEVIELLETYQSNHPYIVNAYVGTANGAMIIWPEGQTVPKDFDPRVRPWYQMALSEPGKVVTTGSYKNAGDGSEVISVAKAISDNGKLIGVVSVDIKSSVVDKLD